MKEPKEEIKVTSLTTDIIKIQIRNVLGSNYKDKSIPDGRAVRNRLDKGYTFTGKKFNSLKFNRHNFNGKK